MATKQTVSAFDCDPNFCATCGAILPLTGIENVLTCIICGAKMDVRDQEGIEIHSSKMYNEEKLRLLSEREAGATQDEAISEGPTVDRKCSKCSHEKMSYMTRQTRSVDEGQTVFYTCLNCRSMETEYS